MPTTKRTGFAEAPIFSKNYPETLFRRISNQSGCLIETIHEKDLIEILAFVEKAGLENDRLTLVSYKNSQANDKKQLILCRFYIKKITYKSYLKYHIELILCLFQRGLNTSYLLFYSIFSYFTHAKAANEGARGLI